MRDDQEWGPIRTHDGAGFPVDLRPGMWVWISIEASNGSKVDGEGLLEPKDIDCTAWYWADPEVAAYSRRRFGKVARIVEYRVRRPRPLRDLIYLVERCDAPAAIAEPEPA